MQKQIQKLVRDNVPQEIFKTSRTPHFHTLEDIEFVQELKRKLHEEAEEVVNAQNTSELIEELADVLEVVEALRNASGISAKELTETVEKKHTAKGGFDKKIFLEAIDEV